MFDLFRDFGVPITIHFFGYPISTQFPCESTKQVYDYDLCTN